MNDEVPFRLAAVAICLVFTPIGAYHRIRSYTGETLDRWQEGTFILFGLRLSALVLFLAGLAWLIEPRWMAWASLPLPNWLRWTGFGIAFCAGVLWSWTVHTLGPNLTDTVVTRQKHTLVTRGPYRWVRHPFYTASAIGLAGGCLMAANWFLALMGALGLFAFLVARTTIEERKLVERFGDAYRDYMIRTGRFIPRFTGSQTTTR